MAASQGAPVWLTIALPIASAAITHYLTLHRERQKMGRDWNQKWLDESKKLISKVSDSALQHYVDGSSLSKTPVSASLIISDIKRIGNLLRESVCINPSDSKSTFDALRNFNNEITSTHDFQDPQREARKPDDPLLAKIRECEQSLLISINKPRKRK